LREFNLSGRSGSSKQATGRCFQRRREGKFWGQKSAWCKSVMRCV